MALSGVDMQGAAAPVPAGIDAAFTELRASRPRPDVELREIPAPGRGVAPLGLAFDAELLPAGDRGEPLVSGRFVVLHDPAGQPAWASTTRIVVLVQGGIDETTGGDPMLPDVTWAWLQESLDGRHAGSHSAKGTVTTTSSRRFGGSGDDAPECEVELRASWSPAGPTELMPHLQAFCDLLAAVAGVPAE